MGSTSSKRKLFRSLRITLNRLRMVAQKWIQNWWHTPYYLSISSNSPFISPFLLSSLRFSFDGDRIDSSLDKGFKSSSFM